VAWCWAGGSGVLALVVGVAGERGDADHVAGAGCVGHAAVAEVEGGVVDGGGVGWVVGEEQEVAGLESVAGMWGPSSCWAAATRSMCTPA